MGGSDALSLRELIDLGDLDELLRRVDRYCDAADWKAVRQLADAARAAHERGRQLWPAAAFAEYRLALEAPGPWCAEVISGPQPAITVGPLTEVAAQHHDLVELLDALPTGPATVWFAHECVVRGGAVPATVEADSLDPTRLVDLPLHLEPWEPRYLVPEYRRNGERRPAEPNLAGPPGDRSTSETVASEVGVRPDRETEAGRRALADALGHWAAQSGGSVRAIGGSGAVTDALATLEVARARVASVTGAEGLGLLAWGAAEGGRHGRRRGAAAGRFDVWWALAHLCGFEPDLSEGATLIDLADDLGEALDELRWFRWWPDHPETGWTCRLIIEDPEHHLVWALDATDPA